MLGLSPKKGRVHMMNLFRNVRFNPAVESAPIQATGGVEGEVQNQTDQTGEVGEVKVRKPTKEDAQMLGLQWENGLKRKAAWTKRTAQLLEVLGPATTSAEDRTAAIEKFGQDAVEFAFEMNEIAEAVHGLPHGTTPPKWVGPDARASVIASVFCKIGSNLDRIITASTATKALRLIFKGN